MECQSELVLSQPAKYFSLEQKTIFITGGATGIGAAMVTAFLKQNAKVAFIDIDGTAADKLLQQLADYQDNLLFEKVDVTNVDTLKQSIDRASEKFGGIDVLINNVANDMRHTPHEV
ncbi:MAG: 3-oxoacyl-ACP reductase, partial [Colwelliaceae bacterium]|nr:3-oxoacyl-ACP reductase [Colwelliaceae bacterium]